MTDKLSKHNRALLQNYQYHLKVEKGLSENSIESYENDISNLLTQVEKDIEKITNKDIINFFVTLQEIGLTNSTIARKRSSIRSFLKFLIEEEVEISADVDDIPSIKPSQRLPDVLSVKQMLKLLDSIPIGKPTDMRNKAILELMYATGIRISETINL
ncbi:MAG: tyrosine recombinase, partial [Candidatus Cloacimonadota bacterium]